MSLDDRLREAQRTGNREIFNFLRQKRGDNLSDIVWTTRDSRKVKITEMDDGHLLNTIKFLKKGYTGYIASDVRRQQVLNALMLEAKQRGLQQKE